MKLKNLTIENFRSFDHFTLSDLGRINLLVGTNNSGKTTILEAANVLLSGEKLSAIWAVLARRGEFCSDEIHPKNRSPLQQFVDVRRLFRDHQINSNSIFRIKANDDVGDSEVEVSIVPASALALHLAQPSFAYTSPPSFSENPIPSLSLNISWKHGAVQNRDSLRRDVLLGNNGGLSSELYTERSEWRWLAGAVSVNFLNNSSLSDSEVASLYERIVLTPGEELVLESLRLIDSRIERMASTTSSEDSNPGYPTRGGILVRLTGTKERVPIASMGDGIWRMLGLALAMVHSANGILLIDEVDTGLHHSVMRKMWQFLDECSKRSNVQIIATTHSRDCYQSLATICREGVVDQSEVTIQRVERGHSEAVAYSEAAIIAAAERDIEVR